MKRKLHTRFPAARIKKIMQSDENVGKMAMAVPLLVSKALELFLQDLCDQTYEITSARGAKTVTSSHLKQCVQSINIFDFLKEVVGKVSYLGGSVSGRDDQVHAKRRKLADYEDGDVEESKELNMHATGYNTNSSGRGQGRGRSRGRGSARGSRRAAGNKFEDDPDIYVIDVESMVLPNGDDSLNSKDNALPVNNVEAPTRNFDLNIDLDVEDQEASALVLGLDNTSSEPVTETTPDEQPTWVLSEMGTIAIDAFHLASFNQQTEEDEDYDKE